MVAMAFVGFVIVGIMAALGVWMGALRRWYTRLIVAALATVPAMAFVPPPPCRSDVGCVDWPFWLFDLALIYGLMWWINRVWRDDEAPAAVPAPAVGPLTGASTFTPAAQPAAQPAAAGGRHRKYTFRSSVKGGSND